MPPDRGETSDEILEKPLIGRRYSSLQINPRGPAQTPKLVRAHQLSGRTIRLRRVGDNVALKANNLTNEARELRYRQIIAGPDIDMPKIRIRLGQMHEGIGAIIDMKKFSARLTRTPNLE